MINKIVNSVAEAVQGIPDGASIMVGGFGFTGTPFELLDAIFDLGIRDLTIISNNAGNGRTGVARLLDAGRVRKLICTYPRSLDCYVVDDLYRQGRIEIELVPQGTFVEKMRAGGAGLGGFYTQTGVGTPLAEGKEVRVLDGKEYLLEKPLRSDVALVKAQTADRWGNLFYPKTGKNFAPIMAAAADLTIAQAAEIVSIGEIDPELVSTPGIFVRRVVGVGEQQ